MERLKKVRNQSSHYSLYRLTHKPLTINLHHVFTTTIRQFALVEGDFEVWLRSSLFHEEIEASVFEQRSLARIEAFWVNWREKVTPLGPVIPYIFTLSINLFCADHEVGWVWEYVMTLLSKMLTLYINHYCISTLPILSINR